MRLTAVAVMVLAMVVGCGHKGKKIEAAKAHAPKAEKAAKVLAGGAAEQQPVQAAIAAVERSVAPAVYVKAGPAIDGTLDSPAWQKAPALVIGKLGSKEVGQLKTTARVLLDDKNLYVAWECMEPDMASLKADVADRDGTVYSDDCAELFIAPDIKKGYYQFIINAKGTLFDGKSDVADEESDTSWNSHAVIKTGKAKDRWIVTMSLPLSDLNPPAGKGQTWLMNLNRTKPGSGDVRWIESSWSAKGTSTYRMSDTWGKLAGVNIAK